MSGVFVVLLITVLVIALVAYRLKLHERFFGKNKKSATTQPTKPKPETKVDERSPAKPEPESSKKPDYVDEKPVADTSVVSEVAIAVEPVVDKDPVVPQPQEEAAFDFQFDKLPQNTSQDTTPADPEPEIKIAPSRNPVIFVVDDSKTIQIKLARLVKSHGYEVRSAFDGLQALALFDAEMPDLLITDIEMPNLDGKELIKKLYENDVTYQIPVLAISGHNNLDEILSDFKNVHGTFLKPWDESLLVGKIKDLVGPSIPA